ncbi:glycosyltransferase family 10 domain-containing protein [Mucilaginibacter antarcticus]|uniref:glycosyltransferase family 10 domain-containing protein n=1 Tax=Mucilaginibacter antarcticus TaxID=1855725 RepID=UPI0036418906
MAAQAPFLSDYKFTIAFENDIYPGYQTEKLYDAMKANSIPIYCGDPFVGDIFYTGSFINAADYLSPNSSVIGNTLLKMGQMDFEDLRPAQLTGLKYRVKRKTKAFARSAGRQLQFKNMDFSPLIERIIELDTKPEMYLQYLKQPWFKQNQPPADISAKSRWIEIFNGR